MDIICIKQDEFKHYTIGETYILVEICDENEKWDVIVDKWGVIHPYIPSNFIPINEWREKQINKLFNS